MRRLYLPSPPFLPLPECPSARQWNQNGTNLEPEWNHSIDKNRFSKGLGKARRDLVKARGLRAGASAEAHIQRNEQEKGETTMKVFGDPRARAKARRYIVWGIEDGIVCASFLGGIALAGWVFHVIFTALGVA